jgi:hypothetical protein
MASKARVTVLNIPESEFELLLRRSSDYLRKGRRLRPLAKPLAAKKRSSAA